jgi:hypothetical protein
MKKNIFISILLFSTLLNAQNQNSYVSEREFLKTKSYPIENLAEYYADMMNSLMLMFDQKSEKKFGFIFPDGKIFKSAEFNYASDFMGDCANVIKDSIPGLLFKNGKIKYFPEYKITYWNKDNLGLAIKKDKYGFIDKKGKLTNITTGLTEFMNNVKGSEYPENLYDLQSKSILNFSEYDEISGFFEYGLMSVSKDRKIGFADKNGKIIIPLVYDEVKDISESKIIVKKESKWGAIDLKNNILIPFEYNFLNPFYEDLAFFSNDINPKNIGYINVLNEVVIQPNLDFCWYGNFKNGIAVAKKDEKYGYINPKGEFIIPNIYKEAFPFSNGMALVKLVNSDKYTFINLKGEIILKSEFTELYPVRNGFARFNE